MKFYTMYFFIIIWATDSPLAVKPEGVLHIHLTKGDLHMKE